MAQHDLKSETPSTKRKEPPVDQTGEIPMNLSAFHTFDLFDTVVEKIILDPSYPFLIVVNLRKGAEGFWRVLGATGGTFEPC